jgi:hypothetical protein
MLLLTLDLSLQQKLSRMLRSKAHTKALVLPDGLRFFLPNPTKFDTNFLPRLSKKAILEVLFFSVIPIFQSAIFGSINFNSLNKSVAF